MGQIPPGFFKRLARINKKAAVGDGAILVELAAEKGGQSETKNKKKHSLFWSKMIEKERKKQGWFRLIGARRRAVCSRWSYPIQTEEALVQGGRAGPA